MKYPYLEKLQRKMSSKPNWYLPPKLWLPNKQILASFVVETAWIPMVVKMQGAFKAQRPVGAGGVFS